MANQKIKTQGGVSKGTQDLYQDPTIMMYCNSAVPCMANEIKTKEETKMASMMKFTHSAVVNQCRHVLREALKPTNTDIDATLSHLNYLLSPDRGIHPYSYYLKRKSQVYCFNRDNVKTLVGWVVTAPRNLPNEQRQKFFQEVYIFLVNKYGLENTTLAVVHQDESQPHLHFLFIPVVPDLKRGGEKICANDLITRDELRNFHPALQKHLKGLGIQASILNDTDAYSRSAKTHKHERKFEQILKKVRDEKC